MRHRKTRLRIAAKLRQRGFFAKTFALRPYESTLYFNRDIVAEKGGARIIISVVPKYFVPYGSPSTAVRKLIAKGFIHLVASSLPEALIMAWRATKPEGAQ